MISVKHGVVYKYPLVPSWKANPELFSLKLQTYMGTNLEVFKCHQAISVEKGKKAHYSELLIDSKVSIYI